jgi:hypothetical protein
MVRPRAIRTFSSDNGRREVRTRLVVGVGAEGEGARVAKGINTPHKSTYRMRVS